MNATNKERRPSGTKVRIKLTDEQRRQRNRARDEARRRARGVKPRTKMTDEERNSRRRERERKHYKENRGQLLADAKADYAPRRKTHTCATCGKTKPYACFVPIAKGIRKPSDVCHGCAPMPPPPTTQQRLGQIAAGHYFEVHTYDKRQQELLSEVLSDAWSTSEFENEDGSPNDRAWHQQLEKRGGLTKGDYARSTDEWQLIQPVAQR